MAVLYDYTNNFEHSDGLEKTDFDGRSLKPVLHTTKDGDISLQLNIALGS